MEDPPPFPLLPPTPPPPSLLPSGLKERRKTSSVCEEERNFCRGSIDSRFSITRSTAPKNRAHYGGGKKKKNWGAIFFSFFLRQFSRLFWRQKFSRLFFCGKYFPPFFGRQIFSRLFCVAAIFLARKKLTHSKIFKYFEFISICVCVGGGVGCSPLKNCVKSITLLNSVSV